MVRARRLLLLSASSVVSAVSSVTSVLARLRAEQRGTVLVIVTVGMATLIGMSALTLDVARFFEMRRQLQNAVDAAAHAGARELPDTAAAATTAQLYWDLNVPSLGDSTFTVTYPDAGQSLIRLEAQGTFNFLLAPIFGIFDVSVGAAAEVSVASREKDVVLVIDRSGSMCSDSHGLRLNCPNPPPDWQPFTQVQEAALAFPDMILTQGLDRIGLVSYSSDAARDMPLSMGYPGWAQHVSDLVPAGYTNIGAAILEAYDTITQGNPNGPELKVIVLLSDGVPNRYWGGNSWKTCSNPGSGCVQAYDYARAQAQFIASQGAVLYTVGLGNSVDEAFMQELASIAGGIYVASPTPAELQAAFETIASSVRISFVE